MEMHWVEEKGGKQHREVQNEGEISDLNNGKTRYHS